MRARRGKVAWRKVEDEKNQPGWYLFGTALDRKGKCQDHVYIASRLPVIWKCRQGVRRDDSCLNMLSKSV